MHPRRALLIMVSLLSCFSLGFGPVVVTDSDVPRRVLTPQQIAGMSPSTEVPQITAASAILVNNTTGQVIYALNEHERRAPASMVKIMTAYVALKHSRLDQQFKVIKADLAVETAAGLATNEEITLFQLLYCLLVSSDNAAANVIARGVAGDVRTFVGWMNDQAAEWGLQDTHFSNPHGLDEADAYTTAYDMAILARHAMQDASLADIVNTKEAVVNKHWVHTTNELIYTYSGTIGVKTGTTDLAGECLIALVDRTEGQVISVVMGSTDRFVDSRLLLDYYYSNFAEVDVNLSETTQNRYQDEEGVWHNLVLSEPSTLLVLPWQRGTLNLYRRMDDLSANPDPNKPVGSLVVTLAGYYVTEVPLYAR
ncbi:MAG: D-alanyl-D-alanine carboxypeptidase family protein [Anaerolineae bacterium]